MTPAARRIRIDGLRASLAAWDPARSSSPRIGEAARTRPRHARRRLERAPLAVQAGRPAAA